MISLPGSKSIAARALICRETLSPATRITGLPDCDDTRELVAALRKLHAAAGAPCRIDAGSGGTTLRFLLAYLASFPEAEVALDCSLQLARRPIMPLIAALRSIGAEIFPESEEALFPLHIKGRQLLGGRIAVDSSLSSQFVSALMLASPLWQEPFQPDSLGTVPVSRPYIEMTAAVMEQFADAPEVYVVEADWSAASYFFEYALLHPGEDVLIGNLDVKAPSLQGDSACRVIFALLGVESSSIGDGASRLHAEAARVEALRRYEQPVSYDLVNTPDLAPALTVALCRSGIHFTLKGVANLRVKESDRIAALVGELRKAGYLLSADSDTLCWSGDMCPPDFSEPFDAHGDHRIAMALAAGGLAENYASIRGAESVSKSFPHFFQELSKLTRS